ncbi:unnamed protein product [Closterium sp. NIES-54]
MRHHCSMWHASLQHVSACLFRSVSLAVPSSCSLYLPPQFAVIKAVRNVVSGRSPGRSPGSNSTAHNNTDSSSGSSSSSRGRGGRRVTALWVTHRLEELQFADGAAYMDGGRVVVMGSVPHVVDYITRQQQQQQAASAGSFWSAFGPT